MSERTICHVIDYGGVTGGSFIPALCTLSRAVVERNERFHVLASEVSGATWGRELRESGAQLEYVRSDADVRASLKRIRPAIVHSHFVRYDRATFGASQARTFWHVHSFRDKQSLLGQLKTRAKYRLLGSAIRAWVCVSEVVRNEIVAYGAPADRTLVVYNGIDTQRFRPPSDVERTRARERFGFAPGERVVLFFDRTPAKGGAVLRDAMDAQPGLTLLLNGGDPANWSAFSTRHRVCVSGRVADARELYWAADLLALPSYGEGFSFVLAEAAACGLPVVGSAIPPVREILGDSPDAFDFPVGDVRAMAARLRVAQAHGYAADARARVKRRFSLERWTAEILSLYDS